MEGSKGQGQSQKPFGLTRVRDTRMPLGTGLMVTPTDPVVRKSEDSLTNRKKKLLNKKSKVQSKEMGGEVMDMTKSEPVSMMDEGGQAMSDADIQRMKEMLGRQDPEDAKKMIVRQRGIGKGMSESDIKRMEEMLGRVRPKKMNMGGVVPGRGGSFKGVK